MVGYYHWLDGHEFGQLKALVMDMESWCATVTKSQTQLSNWTELNWNLKFKLNFTLNNLISKLKLTNHKLTSLRFGKSIQFIYGSLYFNISFFSFSFFKIFIFTLFCFTILYWFCHTLTWIRHGCTWVHNPEFPPLIKKNNFKFI